MGRNSNSFSVLTNAGGSAALFIYPNNAFGTAAVAPFMSECHTASFDPVTGSGVFTPKDGPFTSMAAFVN